MLWKTVATFSIARNDAVDLAQLLKEYVQGLFCFPQRSVETFISRTLTGIGATMIREFFSLVKIRVGSSTWGSSVWPRMVDKGSSLFSDEALTDNIQAAKIGSYYPIMLPAYI